MSGSRRPSSIVVHFILSVSILFALGVSLAHCCRNEDSYEETCGDNPLSIEPPSLARERTFHFFTDNEVRQLALFNASDIAEFCGAASFALGYPCEEPSVDFCNSSGCMHRASCGTAEGRVLENGPAYVVYEIFTEERDKRSDDAEDICYGSTLVHWNKHGEQIMLSCYANMVYTGMKSSIIYFVT